MTPENLTNRLHNDNLRIPASLLDAAAEQAKSTPDQGWSVHLLTEHPRSLENIERNRQLISAYAARLGRHMVDELGFRPEAVKIANEQLLRRYVDRLKINSRTFQQRPFVIKDEYAHLEELANTAAATIPQGLLHMNLTGNATYEAGRVTAPSLRIDYDVVHKLETATFDAIRLLGGTVHGDTEQNPKQEVAYGQHLFEPDETFVRVHDTVTLGELPNGVRVKARLARAAMVDYHVIASEVDEVFEAVNDPRNQRVADQSYVVYAHTPFSDRRLGLRGFDNVQADPVNPTSDDIVRKAEAVTALVDEEYTGIEQACAPIWDTNKWPQE